MMPDPNEQRDAIAQQLMQQEDSGARFNRLMQSGGAGAVQSDPQLQAVYAQLMGGGGGGGMPTYAPPPQPTYSPPPQQAAYSPPPPQAAPAAGSGGAAYLPGGGLDPNDPGNIATYYRLMGGGGGGVGAAPAPAAPASSGPLSGDALLLAMAKAGYAYPTGMSGPKGTGGGIQWSNTGQIPSDAVFNSFINGTYNANAGPSGQPGQIQTPGGGPTDGAGLPGYDGGGGLTGTGGGSDFFGGGGGSYAPPGGSGGGDPGAGNLPGASFDERFPGAGGSSSYPYGTGGASSFNDRFGSWQGYYTPGYFDSTFGSFGGGGGGY